jgi:anti-sigma B factor antagonist
LEITSKTEIIDGKDFVIVSLNDEILSLINQGLIKDFINREIESGKQNFIFDMNAVTSINSSGLGILISVLNKVKASNGIMKLENLNDKIKQIFVITRLNLVFEIR